MLRRTKTSLDRSIARSITHSIARSLDRSLDRSLARSLAHSIARSLSRSLPRSLDRSLARSLARSLTRSIYFGGSNFELRIFCGIIWGFEFRITDVHHVYFARLRISNHFSKELRSKMLTVSKSNACSATYIRQGSKLDLSRSLAHKACVMAN